MPEPEPKRRGRKRKYGRRIDPAVLEALPVQAMELMLYGTVQRIRVRSVLAVARFLKGLPVRAVCCEMFLPDHTWSRPRLILATETNLAAQQVLPIFPDAVTPIKALLFVGKQDGRVVYFRGVLLVFSHAAPS